MCVCVVKDQPLAVAPVKHDRAQEKPAADKRTMGKAFVLPKRLSRCMNLVLVMVFSLLCLHSSLEKQAWERLQEWYVDYGSLTGAHDWGVLLRTRVRPGRTEGNSKNVTASRRCFVLDMASFASRQKYLARADP